MAASTTLLQFLLMLVASWLQRQQAATIDYLKAENRMLRERLGGRRIIFTDAERRQLVARKWTFVERRRPGRPRTREELAALVVRMARENRSWGYTRIQGAMANRSEFQSGRRCCGARFEKYGAHFDQERNHQGLGNVRIMPRVSSAHRVGPVIRRPRLGGLLNYYERAAA
jgi:hypothetical protein